MPFGTIRFSPVFVPRDPTRNSPDSWEDVQNDSGSGAQDDSGSGPTSPAQYSLEDWISYAGELEGDLTKATTALETLTREVEELKTRRPPPCVKCAELRKNLDECRTHFEILVSKNMRETEAAEKARLVERRRNMNSQKEIVELGEDIYNILRLFMYNEEMVRQPQTLLDEVLFDEEMVLSFFVGGKVQETWIKIQFNNTVQMSVMVLNNDGDNISLDCTLHSTHREAFKISTGADWKADRTCVVLLSVIW